MSINNSINLSMDKLNKLNDKLNNVSETISKLLLIMSCFNIIRVLLNTQKVWVTNFSKIKQVI